MTVEIGKTYTVNKKLYDLLYPRSGQPYLERLIREQKLTVKKWVASAPGYVFATYGVNLTVIRADLLIDEAN